MLIIEDVTNQIMENQKNNIFGERNFIGKIMNKEITDYMKQNNGKLGCLFLYAATTGMKNVRII